MRSTLKNSKWLPLFFVLFFHIAAYAAAGDLDPTFNGNGKLAAGVGGGEDRAAGMIRQADGKLIVVGSTLDGRQDIGEAALFTLVRYNTNGSLDTTFGTGGKVRTLVGTRYCEATAVALSGTSILVAGYADSSLTGTPVEFALVKYTATGALDTTFGTGGMVLTDFASTVDHAEAIAVQSNGKIVLAGESASQVAVARYNANGTLDTTFDGDGKATVTVGAPYAPIVNAVAVTGTNVFVGVNTASNANAAIVDFNADGSINTSFGSFGTPGTLTLEEFSANQAFHLYGIAIIAPADVDGVSRLAIVGDFQPLNFNGTPASSQQVIWVRFADGGSPDNTFGTNGRVVTPLTNSYGRSIQYFGGAVNRIVTAGIANDDFMVTKYKLDGAADTAFNGDGIATADIFGIDSARAFVVQPDNKIVLAGNSQGGSPDHDFAIARFDTNGNLDPSFSGDGRRTEDIGNKTPVVAGAMLIQPDGKIVAAGDSIVARFYADGSFDTSFDEDGKVKLPGGTGGIALQTDGKIVVGGTTRLNPNGSIDPTFNSTIVGGAVAIQTDGKIIVLHQDSVSRLLPSGALDTPFGNNGTASSPPAFNISFGAMGIQPDGKIVAVGALSLPFPSTEKDFAIVRYNTNGSLDTSFSGDGVQTTNFSTGNGDAAHAIAIQSGKIVVAGTAFVGSHLAFAVASYDLSNGALDTTFGGGKVTTTIGTLNSMANGIAVQSDGKVLVVGITETALGNNDFAIVRYNTNGSADTLASPTQGFSTRGNFSDTKPAIFSRAGAPDPVDQLYGTGGKIVLDCGGNDLGNAIALDASGNAVVVGMAANLFGIIRLQGDQSSPTISISGRILTSGGRGVRNAMVNITDGGSFSVTTMVGPLGVYSFANVASGKTYTISVASKRFHFTPRTLQATDNVTGYDLIALP